MHKLLASLLCLSMAACASSTPLPTVATATTVKDAPPTQVDCVVATHSRDLHWGHAAPITPNIALLAAHLPEREAAGDSRVNWSVPLTWGDMNGNEGDLDPMISNGRQDWALMLSDVAFPCVIPIAPIPPKIGDRVWIVGFAKKGLSPIFWKSRVVDAKLTARRAKYFYYDSTPGPGSSGSPILNDKGELVGVNAAGDFEADIGVGIPITDEQVQRMLFEWMIHVKN